MIDAVGNELNFGDEVLFFVKNGFWNGIHPGKLVSGGKKEGWIECERYGMQRSRVPYSVMISMTAIKKLKGELI